MASRPSMPNEPHLPFIGIEIKNNVVILDAPYHPDLSAKARSIGGKWGPPLTQGVNTDKKWTFLSDLSDVRALCRDIFGYDDSGQCELVDIRLVLDASQLDTDVTVKDMWLFGRRLFGISPPQVNPPRVWYENSVIPSNSSMLQVLNGSIVPLRNFSQHPVTMTIKDVSLSLLSHTTDNSLWAINGHRVTLLTKPRISKCPNTGPWKRGGQNAVAVDRKIQVDDLDELPDVAKTISPDVQTEKYVDQYAVVLSKTTHHLFNKFNKEGIPFVEFVEHAVKHYCRGMDSREFTSQLLDTMYPTKSGKKDEDEAPW